MPAAHSQFVFRAMTSVGATTFGVRPALDSASLAEELRRDQLLLLKAWRLPIRASATPRFSLRDECALNDQLAILLSRGVPLVESLEVAATVVTGKTRARVQRLREFVAAGDSFSGACAKLGGFDEVTIAVYRAAERTGDLAGAAKRLAVSARRRRVIQGKAITVMIYPAVIFTVSMLIFMGMLVFLVPMIAHQMEQMKAAPPAFSRAVFATGIWLNGHLMWAALALGLLIVAIIILHRRVLAALNRIAQRLPAISSLLLTVEMARFFSVMGAMVKSGVPLADAMSTSTVVISSVKLRTQLQTLQRGLVEGGIWSKLVERVDSLPLSTRRLLVAAERSGDLDSAFDGLSSDLSDEVDTRSARLMALLEPAAIILMFMLIGPLILAIAIPLMTFRTQT
jgi:type II secretory pathway component PulF